MKIAHRFHSLLLVATSVAASLAGLNCSDDGSTTGLGGDGAGSTGTAGSGAMAGQSTGGSTGSFVSPEVVSVEVEPAMATIVVDSGMIPLATDFKLIGTTSTGAEIELADAVWFFDRPDIATTDFAGDVSATGLVGGKGILRGSYDNLMATADVTVQLVFVDDTQAIDPGIKTAFDNPVGPDPLLALLYPYDQTVFPRGLIGPELQWNGGTDTDVYKIKASSDTFSFTSWTTAPNPSRFNFPQLPSDMWRLMTNSTDGVVTLDVQRYDGAQAYSAKTQSWTIAPASLAGTIYYWEINQGNVVRLKPGATAPEQFLQKPPGVTCVACHSVSANGSTLVATFHGGYSPWGTFNTSDGSSIYATDTASGFQAISPTGSHVLYGQSQSSSTLTLSTSTNLMPLTTLTTPTGAPAHPTWSNVGGRFAYGVRADGNWLDFTNASLYVANVDTTVPSITNQQQIVAAGAEGFPVNTYPSFSPDSQWIAFQRSNTARTRAALGEVWVTNLDGTTRIPLTRMNGTGVLPGVEGQATYQPTFLPVAVGGYFWLVAESERTYGNRLTDTNPATRRKQLWVSAISTTPQAGVDPSNPGFWLPGQELNNQNMRGAWALDPCKEIGETCEAGFECCEGFCVYDPDVMDYVCGEQEGCSPNGSACETAEDCCEFEVGAQCINGFCAGVAQ